MYLKGNLKCKTPRGICLTKNVASHWFGGYKLMSSYVLATLSESPRLEAANSSSALLEPQGANSVPVSSSLSHNVAAHCWSSEVNSAVVSHAAAIFFLYGKQTQEQLISTRPIYQCKTNFDFFLRKLCTWFLPSCKVHQIFPWYLVQCNAKPSNCVGCQQRSSAQFSGGPHAEK